MNAWFGMLVVSLVLQTSACASRQPAGTGPEVMPEPVLDKSDPTVDTSSHRKTRQGGCGGLLNPCPNVASTGNKGCGLFGYFPCNSPGSTSVGCGCSSSSAKSQVGWLIVFFLLFGFRRRRLGGGSMSPPQRDG